MSAALPVIVPEGQAPAIVAAEELEQAFFYARASHAPSTLRAYASDWRRWQAWCGRRDLPALPADPQHVAVFLAAEAAGGTSPPTIGRRLAAIIYHHHEAGLLPPNRREGAAALARVLAGIRRSRVASPVRKAAADADIVWQMLAGIRGDRLRDHRDRALIALGMAGALRRSELVALRVEDLERVSEGLRLTVRRSKTDQEGHGHTIAVPNGRRLRPVDLVEAWTTAASITEGWLFRRFISRADRLSVDAMHASDVALAVKRRAAAAGLDPTLFSAHSLRAGFLTSAARSGASIWKMQQVSRHKSVQVLSTYVRDAELFEGHAGSGFL